VDRRNASSRLCLLRAGCILGVWVSWPLGVLGEEISEAGTAGAYEAASAVTYETAGANEAGPADAEDAVRDVRRVDVGLFPFAGYRSDLGLGGGLDAALFVRHPDHAPYQLRVDAIVSGTTRGMQNHEIRLDAPDLFGGAVRYRVRAGYLRDLEHPYFGIGNTSPAGDKAEVIYDLAAPYLFARADRRYGGHWLGSIEYRLAITRLEDSETARLRAEQPLGYEGGPAAELEVEVAYDSRDVEASPTRGVFIAANVRGADRVIGSRWTYAGAGAMVRVYHAPGALGPRLVLAARLGADLAVGDVPVARLSAFGGSGGLMGLGGAGTLRGLPRFRYLGKVKLLSNFEVRSRLHRFSFGERTLDLWPVVFLDAGRVWAGYAADGPFPGLHLTGGGGLRLAWVEDYVVRMDFGAGGGHRGFYVTFGQLF
jgi:hypothetical protein